MCVKYKIDSEGVCRKTELTVCKNFEPDKTSNNECVACPDGKISEDGMKCVNIPLSSSSSGGLSGGAIAGIAIAGVVVVGVIGFAIFFVSKGAALFGAVNAGTATYSQAATSSLSNINASNKH